MENKKRLTITLSSQVLKYLSETAKNKGLSKSALITVALENTRKGKIKHKKERTRLKVRSFGACFDKAILTLWLKTRQGTSPFCYIQKAFLLIGNSV